MLICFFGLSIDLIKNQGIALTVTPGVYLYESHIVYCFNDTWQYVIWNGRIIQGDTKKRELLKCVVAAMYSWQHCGTGTLSFRQPRRLVTMDQWNGQQRAVAMKMFYMFGFLQSSRFFCVTLYML
jgi:hypothetical protein